MVSDPLLSSGGACEEVHHPQQRSAAATKPGVSLCEQENGVDCSEAPTQTTEVSGANVGCPLWIVTVIESPVPGSAELIVMSRPSMPATSKASIAHIA